RCRLPARNRCPSRRYPSQRRRRTVGPTHRSSVAATFRSPWRAELAPCALGCCCAAPWRPEGRRYTGRALPGGEPTVYGQPLCAAPTAAISSLMATLPSPLTSHAGQPERSPPSAMLTQLISSLMATVPSPLQSPGQLGVASH